MYKLTLQQQRYLRAIENKYFFPRWKDTGILLADLYERTAQIGISDNEAVHTFVKIMFNKGKSTNDLPMPGDEWLAAFRAYWQLNGFDIPPPNAPELEDYYD